MSYQPPTNERLREIVKLAQEATPGPWKAGNDFVYSESREGGDEYEKRDGHYRGELVGESIRAHNRGYIAALDPSTVEAMARELLRLRGWSM